LDLGGPLHIFIDLVRKFLQAFNLAIRKSVRANGENLDHANRPFRSFYRNHKNCANPQATADCSIYPRIIFGIVTALPFPSSDASSRETMAHTQTAAEIRGIFTGRGPADHLIVARQGDGSGACIGGQACSFHNVIEH
jgi:hypothetical protein